MSFMSYWCHRALNLSQFCSTASCFCFNGNFATSGTNGPKLTLNATRSKIPLICFTSVPESQILVYFVLQRAVFELTGRLRHEQRMTNNALERNNVKGTSYMCSSTNESQFSIIFVIRPAFLESHVILRKVQWMTSKWPWTIAGQR